jgi:hypothetical protein
MSLHKGYVLCGDSECPHKSITGLKHAHGPDGRVQWLREAPLDLSKLRVPDALEAEVHSLTAPEVRAALLRGLDGGSPAFDRCRARGYSRAGHWSNEPRCSDFVEAPAEPTPNARARDAAVVLLESVLADVIAARRYSTAESIRAAIVCLEAIK